MGVDDNRIGRKVNRAALHIYFQAVGINPAVGPRGANHLSKPTGLDVVA
jgi:hypothetical protein